VGDSGDSGTFWSKNTRQSGGSVANQKTLEQREQQRKCFGVSTQ